MIIRWFSRGGQHLVPGAFVFTWRLRGGAGLAPLAAYRLRDVAGPKRQLTDLAGPVRRLTDQGAL